jgi:hypothetical protein
LASCYGHLEVVKLLKEYVLYVPWLDSESIDILIILYGLNDYEIFIKCNNNVNNSYICIDIETTVKNSVLIIHIDEYELFKIVVCFIFSIKKIRDFYERQLYC